MSYLINPEPKGDLIYSALKRSCVPLSAEEILEEISQSENISKELIREQVMYSLQFGINDGYVIYDGQRYHINEEKEHIILQNVLRLKKLDTKSNNNATN